MKSASKIPKVNSLSLAKAAAQFLAKIEFDLQPLLQDKVMAETIERISNAIGKLEEMAKNPDKTNPSELSQEFQKTDKALEKAKDKINDLQTSIEKIEKTLQEKLMSKPEILRKTDPKDAVDKDNRNKVETHMKSMKNLLETSRKKLQDVQQPAEAALKKMQAIKPKLYALGIPDNFERCQKRAERLNEEISELCHATSEMTLTEAFIVGSALILKDAAPAKLFLPRLQAEIEKSSSLLHQAGIHLRRVFPKDSDLVTVPLSNGAGCLHKAALTPENTGNSGNIVGKESLATNSSPQKNGDSDAGGRTASNGIEHNSPPHRKEESKSRLAA